MAKRMGAKTIEVKASHLSLISHPDKIARLILEAAGASLTNPAQRNWHILNGGDWRCRL